MGFPPDVRGLYVAPAQEVEDGPRGKPLRRSVTAYVYHNRIDFLANQPPSGEEDTQVQVFSNNNDPDPGYDSSNPDEWKSGNNPSVKLDHSYHVPQVSPLVFTNLKKQIPYNPSGVGAPYPTPVFTFEYQIPLFTKNAGDPPWVFTKTGRSGGVKDWDTPIKDPKPIGGDPDNPVAIEDPVDGGMDSNLIMLAIVLMVATVIAVNM